MFTGFCYKIESTFFKKDKYYRVCILYTKCGEHSFHQIFDSECIFFHWYTFYLTYKYFFKD